MENGTTQILYANGNFAEYNNGVWVTINAKVNSFFS